MGDKLTNIVAGHHFPEALLVEDYEKIHGAQKLQAEDIKHKILVIKINKLYQKNVSEEIIYDTVRGVWRASIKKAQETEYFL